MLRDRLLTSAILLAIVAFCLVVDARAAQFGLPPGLVLLPLLLLCALGTSWELARLIEISGRPIRRSLAVTGCAITTLAAAVPLAWEIGGGVYPPNCPVGRLGWIVVGGICSAGLAFCGEMSIYGRGPRGALERIAAAVMISTYVGMPMGLLVAVRNLGGDANWGLSALVSLIAVTKASDVGAYFTGRLLGRHKLIPRLSPAKTWEGAVGGVVLSVAVAYGCLYWLFPAISAAAGKIPWWGPITLGVVCGVSGMFGDLAESLIKRDSGVKDSGGLLPGMGGVWDVTDSLIGASLPAFLCFAAGVAGPCISTMAWDL